MSLPSLDRMLAQAGVDPRFLTEKKLEEFTLAAMKKDLPLACDFLHTLSHGDGTVSPQDPNSDLGKQLIRICAGDVLRELAERHICHGKTITFYNCCAPATGDHKPPRREMLLTQLQCQAGPVAYADC